MSLCLPGPSDRQSKLVQRYSEKLGCLQMVHGPDLSAAPAAMVLVLQHTRRLVASLLHSIKREWTAQTHICIKGKEKQDNISSSVKPGVFYFLLDDLSFSLLCVFNHFWEVLLFSSSLSLFCIAAVNVNSVGSVFCLGFKMFYSFNDALWSGAEKMLEDMVPINLEKGTRHVN